ncbi:hypothetical protein CEXT_723611 [Caerostris extrusa]|uniref:Uncharacterized protein n=1 Tax=Caerostris extrusa TaxID=172846 RepID=A0AAV4M5F1_CAEEX|nr:hypothetical protein CEXT_723611 [Caerostris extrusa]
MRVITTSLYSWAWLKSFRVILRQHKTNAISAVLKSNGYRKARGLPQWPESMGPETARKKQNLRTMPLLDGRKRVCFLS